MNVKCIHTYIHTQIQTYTHTRMHAYLHTYLLLHTHTHTHRYIYIYIYIYIYACRKLVLKTQKVPTTHAICSPSVGGAGEEVEQKQNKGPNTCQLKFVRPEQRKY